MKGDTNGDGTINSVDIVEIVKYLIGNKPNVLKEDAADINGDGVVNIADIVKLVSVIMGI